MDHGDNASKCFTASITIHSTLLKESSLFEFSRRHTTPLYNLLSVFGH